MYEDDVDCVCVSSATWSTDGETAPCISLFILVANLDLVSGRRDVDAYLFLECLGGVATEKKARSAIKTTISIPWT